jgi:hypothetical protein
MGPTGSRKRSGGRGPCSYCARDGRNVVHIKAKVKPEHPLYPRRSCKGKGVRFYD